MSERGFLIEVVEPVFGPIKRRSLREEWFRGDVLAFVIPRHSHLTLSGQPGARRLLGKLLGPTGGVEAVRPERVRW